MSTRKPTLDKDLDKLGYVETAVSAMGRGLVAPGLGLAFLVLVMLAAAAAVSGLSGAWIIVAAAVIGGFVSLVAVIRQPSWLAGSGVFLGLVATLVSLAAVWLVAMLGLATHPV